MLRGPGKGQSFLFQRFFAVICEIVISSYFAWIKAKALDEALP